MFIIIRSAGTRWRPAASWCAGAGWVLPGARARSSRTLYRIAAMRADMVVEPVSWLCPRPIAGAGFRIRSRSKCAVTDSPQRRSSADHYLDQLQSEDDLTRSACPMHRLERGGDRKTEAIAKRF